MRALFWMIIGAGMAVFVVLRGKEMMHRLTPRGMQEQVAERGKAAAAGLGDFVAVFRAARAEREAELRRELNLPRND